MMSESRVLGAANGCLSFLWRGYTRSRTRDRLLGLCTFLHASFSASMFLRAASALPRLYPGRVWRVFDAVDNRVPASLDIFHPVFIYPAVFLGFLAISTYRVSNLALFSIAVGIAFFAAGFHATRGVRFRRRGLPLEDSLEKLTLMLLFIGVSSLVIDVIQTGSIPLLDPGARRRLNVPLTMLASLTVPGGLMLIALIGRRYREKQLSLAEARMYALAAALGVTLLMSLLGYRTQIIVSLLGAVVAMYYTRLLGRTEILISFAIVFAAIAAFGYQRALAQGTTMDFLDILGKRAALTLSVYDRLVERFHVFGVNRGTVFLAGFSSLFSFIPGPRLGPRTIVAHMFGVRDVSMTSTMYGTVVVDFGIPGIAFFSLVLGAVLGLGYRAVKQTGSAAAIGVFSLLLAYTLVGVETGLVDFNVIAFFSLGLLVFIKSRRP
jgi:oligosaccharide repeat unit polymerase